MVGRARPERLYLDVPFAEKDDAKRAGARWDAGARRWYVDARAEHAPLARWLSPALPAGPSVPVRVYAMAQTCYRCARPTRCIVGVTAPAGYADDPDGFVSIEECGDALAAALPAALLREHAIGSLRRRSSRAHPQPYTANGCVHCDALIGGFPLAEDLAEWLASGHRLTELHLVTTADLPLATLSSAERSRW